MKMRSYLEQMRNLQPFKPVTKDQKMSKTVWGTNKQKFKGHPEYQINENVFEN